MSNDGALALFLYIIASIVFMVYATNQMTNDYKIRNTQKIQIGNAVYTCNKIQELDLK